MSNLQRVIRREKNRQRFEKSKDGKPYQVRMTFRLDYLDKKALMKKTGLSFQKSIQKLVKEFLSE